MALRASHAHVRTRQREFRERIVIERCRIPRAGAVAGLTSSREARLRMGRIVGLVEIRHMAAVAGGGRVVEFPARVTSGAIQRGVRARQRETGELQVIKLRAHPVVHGVALLARDRETQGDVINADGLGADEILLMAGVAGGREALELPDGSASVALIAIQRGVRADQGEPIQMLIDLLH